MCTISVYCKGVLYACTIYACYCVVIRWSSNTQLTFDTEGGCISRPGVVVWGCQGEEWCGGAPLDGAPLMGD